MDELEGKIGLIERKRQGLGKPNLIYVKNFISPVEKEDNSSPSHFLKCENHTSGDVKITLQEVRKSHGSFGRYRLHQTGLYPHCQWWQAEGCGKEQVHETGFQSYPVCSGLPQGEHHRCPQHQAVSSGSRACCKIWRTTMQRKADDHAIHKQTLMTFHTRKSLHSAKKSSREWTELQHRTVGTGTMKINLSNERLASQRSFDLSLTCESL